MAEHKITCPGCEQHISVPEEMAGQRIDCPSCRKPMTIPTFAAVEVDAEDEEEWVEEPSRQSSKLIVGIAAGILVLGVVAFTIFRGGDSPSNEPELASTVSSKNEPTDSDPPPKPTVPEQKTTQANTDEIEEIKERLAKGEPLDQYNEDGFTELFIAIDANDVDLVKRLLAAGANPNAPDRFGPVGAPFESTPLFSAVKKVSRELTELLLTNGANVNHKDGAGLTTTDYALMALSGEEDPDKAEHLSDLINYLKANGGVHLTKEERRTALFNRIDSMMAGMGMGMNPSGAPASGSTNNWMTMNPLGYGMMPLGGDPFGMGLGYNYNNQGAKGGIPPGFMGGGGHLDMGGMNAFGSAPEDVAELFKDEIEEIKQRLAKGEPLDQYNSDGFTELMIAAKVDDLDLAKRLLEKKANPNLTVSEEEDPLGMAIAMDAGQSALHMAAGSESKAMCELLYNNGALLNVKDSMGFTPLDVVLSHFDPQPDFSNPLSQKKVKPKMTREGRATIAFLRGKGGKNLTAKQRTDIWKANDPFQSMMAPPGMMPGMMPGYGMPGMMPGYGMPGMMAPRSESKKRERK